jgi:integrase
MRGPPPPLPGPRGGRNGAVEGRLIPRLLPYFDGRAMGNINYLDVEKFIAAKIAEGLSPKKVRDAVSVTSLLMKCAVRANARKDNPAAGHQIRVPKRKLRPGDVPDMADIERLVAHVRDPYKPEVWLLAFTGMRPSELCGLRVRSIDFTRRRVRISETLLLVHRYAGLPYSLVGGPPKTDAGPAAPPGRSMSVPGIPGICQPTSCGLWLRNLCDVPGAARTERLGPRSPAETRRRRQRRGSKSVTPSKASVLWPP